MTGLGNLALGYAAGALSTLSPCVLPTLPIILFGVIERHALGPLALAAGLSASFAGVGTVIASVGFSIGLDPSALRLAIAALMSGMGIVLLVPALQGRLATVATPVATKGQALLDRVQPSGIGGQFVLGVLLGVIWSPCSGPTLGAAIGLAAQGDNVGTAAATMISFGLGAATPILALAYAKTQACKKWTLTNLPRRFPVTGQKFPVPRNIFPVNLSRELFKKWLQHSGLLLRKRLSEPQNCKIPCKIP